MNDVITDILEKNGLQWVDDGKTRNEAAGLGGFEFCASMYDAGINYILRFECPYIYKGKTDSAFISEAEFFRQSLFETLYCDYMNDLLCPRTVKEPKQIVSLGKLFFCEGKKHMKEKLSNYDVHIDCLFHDDNKWEG